MASIEELYNEADRLKDAGQYQEAIAKCDEIFAMNPDHVLTHLTMSVLKSKVGEYEQAIKHAQQACDLDPSDAFNFTALSVTYRQAANALGNNAYVRLAEDARDRAQMLQGKHRH